MQNWLPFFVVIGALGVVVQAAVLTVMYMEFHKANQRAARMATELHEKFTPILARLQVFVEDVQPRITSIVTDASEVTHLARGQVQKLDRVLTEAADRLRTQVIHADQIVTGALETIEEAGSRFRRTVWGPVHQASAFIKGVKVGLDFFRSQRRPPERSSEHQDEGLFI